LNVLFTVKSSDLLVHAVYNDRINYLWLSIYRILAVLKAETDIITSFVANPMRTSCDTNDDFCPDL
jgi:hypothetical protein